MHVYDTSCSTHVQHRQLRQTVASLYIHITIGLLWHAVQWMYDTSCIKQTITASLQLSILSILYY